MSYLWTIAATVDYRQNRGLSPQPWTIAVTVDCCRNRGLSPKPWIVAATMDYRQNRGFLVSSCRGIAVTSNDGECRCDASAADASIGLADPESDTTLEDCA